MLLSTPYSPAKFEVAASKGLGGDAFTRIRTYIHTDRQRDRQWTDFDAKLIFPFFLKKKNGYYED